MDIDHYTINANNWQQRVDNFLFKTLGNVPKSRIYRAIRKGEVRVNKGRVNATYKLQVGDLVRVPRLKDPKADLIISTVKGKTNWHIPIAYEDEQVIVVHKPHGLPVHGGSNHLQGVISILRQQYPQLEFLELAHRIDKDTSGCLLLAKSRGALLSVQEGFKQQMIKKTYLAVLHGCLKKDSYSVNVGLVVNSHNNYRHKTMLATPGQRGKPAATDFKVLRRFANATLVAAYPKTGRTHQIRVHAASLGHHIIGDDRYGDRQQNLYHKEKWGKRLYLHAAAVDLTKIKNTILRGLCIPPAAEWSQRCQDN